MASSSKLSIAAAALLLSFLFLAEMARSDSQNGSMLLPHGRVLSAFECGEKCSYRCSKASRAKLCLKNCNVCCRACNCVPPGTAGNRGFCPCYANLKNSKGTGKCP